MVRHCCGLEKITLVQLRFEHRVRVALLAASLLGWPVAAQSKGEPAQNAPAPEVPAPAAVVAPAAETDDAQLSEDRNGAVVTASGREEQRALASANVTSVNWEEIAQRGYHSLGEILSDLPGLYVIDDGVLPSVGVRGVTGGLRGGTRIVKIMINGVPVNFRPDLTAFLGPEYLPVQMIERVEIARGPLSALYGANAFLATVNVLTRGQSSGAQVVAEATGRVNLARASVGYGGSIVGGYDEKDRSLLVAVSTDRIDRSGLTISRTFPDQDPTLARFRPFFGDPSRGDLASPTSVFAQYRIRSERFGNWMFQGGIQRLDSMGEFQLSSVLTHRSRISLENDWVSARHEKSWTDAVSTAVWLGWSRGQPTGEERLYLTGNNDVSFTRRFRYHAIDGAAELVVAPLASLSIKGGLDFSYEPQQVLHYTEQFNAPQGTNRSGDTLDLIGANDQRLITMANTGAYLQATESPIQNLHLTENFRVDLPNLYSAQYSWRGAIAYQWSNNVSTKLIGGRAFQAPSATMLFGLPGFGSANNVIGNRTRPGALPLNPQVIHSLEAVTSLQLFGRLALEASLYAQQVDDKIEFAQAGSQFQPKNQGQQRNLGVELSGRFVYGRYSMQLSSSLQRPLIDDQLVDVAPALYPNAMVVGRFNIAAPELKVNLNGQVRWVGERGASQSNVALNNDEPYTLPAYATVDLSLSTLGLNFLGGAQTVVVLSMKNVLDRHIVEPGFGGFDLPTLGRTTLLELRQSF